MRPAPTSSRHPRRGISLLEVLISIGILSIGLLATLSLIPAGRTYMYKAAVDDRAAAMIPAAFETITVSKLLSVNSLSWEVPPVGTTTDPEQLAAPQGVVVREQDGFDTLEGSLTGRLNDSKWTFDQASLRQTTTEWHPQHPQPPESTTLAISGMVDPSTVSAGAAVTLRSTPPSWIPVASVPFQAGGSWQTQADLPANLTPPATVPDMKTVDQGPGIGTISSDPWWTDFTITGTYTDTMGTPRSANPTPATHRQYGRRRATDVLTGTATTRYNKPSWVVPQNDVEASASDMGLATLDNASTTGRNVAARSVTRTIKGALWQMNTGTVQMPFTRTGTYADADNAPIDWINGIPNADIATDVGPFVGGPTPEKDEFDWWQLPVRAGEIIQLAVGTTTYLKPDVSSNLYFPVFLNSQPLDPVPALSVAGVRYAYFIEQDGTLKTRAQLADGAINTVYLRQPTADLTRSNRKNVEYSFTMSRYPTDRLVVVDPLAATRLDKAIATIGEGSGRENVWRRQRFADFYQTYADRNGTRQRIVPRLNMKSLTTGDVDYALAVSELLFRDADSLLLDTSGTRASADVAPGPLFDMSAGDAAVRRQTAGKMSWLMMLQPQDPGPAAINWAAGKWFDVSVVVFEDRALPALSGGSFTGEYAQSTVKGQWPLAGVWSDLDGSLTVTISSSTDHCDLTDDEEIRRLFRTGGWILLAPKWISSTTNPLEDTQRLEWVKIQSARLGASGGVRTVSLLLEKEPERQTLSDTLQESQPGFNPARREYDVVVLAYSGVVAVVNRSVQLEN